MLTDASGAVTMRRYVYDGANLIAELDGEDHLLTEFLHGPGIDQPLAMTRAGRTYTYQADALGSILAIIDDTNAVVQRYRYDAWGNILEVQDPHFKQPFAYTGREWDEESGLYYYRARYYDSKAGRFVQSDPIGLNGGMNTYAYVGGEPTGATDPLGLARCSCKKTRDRRLIAGTPWIWPVTGRLPVWQVRESFECIEEDDCNRTCYRIWSCRTITHADYTNEFVDDGSGQCLNRQSSGSLAISADCWEIWTDCSVSTR